MEIKRNHMKSQKDSEVIDQSTFHTEEKADWIVYTK